MTVLIRRQYRSTLRMLRACIFDIIMLQYGFWISFFLKELGINDSTIWDRRFCVNELLWRLIYKKFVLLPLHSVLMTSAPQSPHIEWKKNTRCFYLFSVVRFLLYSIALCFNVFIGFFNCFNSDFSISIIFALYDSWHFTAFSRMNFCFFIL